MDVFVHKKHMLLLLPQDNTYYYKGLFKPSVSYAPLTLLTLAALVPKQCNYIIDIVDEGVQKLNLNKKYDLVGITCVASSAPRAYQLASKYKNEGSLVILGGAHPTLNPQEASKHADVVVAGYAEKIWPEILIKLKNGKELEKIYYNKVNGTLSYPKINRDLIADSKYLNIPTVFASRGCRHNCSFCSINIISCKSACSRPVDEVIDEIKQLKSRNIIMLDPNIIADKEYAFELFEKLIPLNKSWAGLATLSLARDPELFKLAVKSGCSGILVGFESVRQKSLDECGKPNYQQENYKENIKLFHKNGIGVLGCFVLGFDNDDESVFQDTVKFIDENSIDLPRFAVLTPFPGTRIYNKYKEEGRILTDDLSLYDTEHVVYQPQNMSAERLQQGLYETWKKTYQLNRIIKRTINIPSKRFIGLAASLGFRFYAKKLGKS